MATIEQYGCYTISASGIATPRLEGPACEAVSPYNGSLQTTFALQDHSSSPSHDSPSISRQLCGHIWALLRLAFVLFVMCLKPAARVCHSLLGSILQLIDSTMDTLPRWAQLLGISLRSRIRTRCPRLWRLIDRTIVLPIQIMQAIIKFNATTRSPPSSYKLQQSSSPLEFQIGTLVTIRLVERPSTVPADYHNRQDRVNLTQISALTSLDDIPTLEERSVCGLVRNELLERSPSPKKLLDTSKHSRKEAPTTEDSPEHGVEANTRCQNIVPNISSFDSHGPCSPRNNSVSHGSVDRTGPPQRSPKDAITTMRKSDYASTYRSRDSSGTFGADSATPDAESSSISSDPAHAESFSPVQLSLPYTIRDEAVAGVQNLPTCPLRGSRKVEQLSRMPFPLAHGLKQQDDRPSTISHLKSSRAKDPRPDIMKWAQKSRHNSNDSQPAFNDPFQENDDDDCCISETASCCDEPCTRRARLSPLQRSEGDDSHETCISCETCDRRHKRNRHSRIPRRVKPVEHAQRRSSSLTSYHSAQTTASAGTVVKRKVQKRKVRVY
jgi:hypothetical protein